ncbi:FMN-binding glutamate synthase family protein [Candidatus Marinamargulisbacteria bacterium SCGC AAA071-K20]|nr:FMN-binding glutamate synthase family protein [Candidatus Marinamargulisbacteria bacterium SCGC AAA071-K20]
MIQEIGLAVLGILVLVFFHDILQKKHVILHNFPIVGHLRYLLEKIGPELRQYWVATDKEERPFNRSERAWIYATSKGQNSSFGFGTTEEIQSTGYPIIKQSTFPFTPKKDSDNSKIVCAKIIGSHHKRNFPYQPKSVINISAMSFGSLGHKAVSALNKGAKLANSFHNTGEGSISSYHDSGADLVWQIGTGYFGCRNKDGSFSIDKMMEKIKKHPQVKMIEIKLSQGAKPAKGGILPGQKVTKEIANIRGIEIGKTCYSPNKHSAFNDVKGLIDFVELIANKTGRPVGIKSAVGDLGFWEELATLMMKQKQGPDFITIDGGEGGTGAAPLSFSDHVSLPFKLGFTRVYKIFKTQKLASKVTWIGSAKLGFPDRAVVAFAMGCDLINIAREAMISIGCIQAQKCHEGSCPAGIATQSKWLQDGVDVNSKAARCHAYLKGFSKEVLELTHACGHEHPCELNADDIEFSTGINQFTPLDKVLGYRKEPVKLA